MTYFKIIKQIQENIMAITQVTDENFDDKVIGSKIPVVVDFWAEFVGPCKQQLLPLKN